MGLGGGVLRLIKVVCYLVAFCCATVITGAFAWFIADWRIDLNNRDYRGWQGGGWSGWQGRGDPGWHMVRRDPGDEHDYNARDVASLAIGAITMLYTLTAALLTCCTAGISFFGFISIFLDVVFAALMIAVAAINQSATDGCDGPPYPRVVDRGAGLTSCELFVAAFALAIVAIFMFVITAVTQLGIRRRGHHIDTSKS